MRSPEKQSGFIAVRELYNTRDSTASSKIPYIAKNCIVYIEASAADPTNASFIKLSTGTYLYVLATITQLQAELNLPTTPLGPLTAADLENALSDTVSLELQKQRDEAQALAAVLSQELLGYDDALRESAKLREQLATSRSQCQELEAQLTALNKEHDEVAANLRRIQAGYARNGLSLATSRELDGAVSSIEDESGKLAILRDSTASLTVEHETGRIDTRYRNVAIALCSLIATVLGAMYAWY